MNLYITNCRKGLCDNYQQKVSDTVYVSLLNMPLSTYVQACRAYCVCYHKSPCVSCEAMLRVATSVLSRGYLSLSYAFSIVSPGVKYTAEKARRKLLQMPLIAICVGSPASGKSFTLLLERFHGVDYSKISLVLQGMVSSFKDQNHLILEKACVKMLVSLAQTDRERECIKYAIVKASGMTATCARRKYGFERMTERTARVEHAIVEVEKIRETIEDIARIQDTALLASFGIQPESCSSEDESFDCDDRTMCGGCELSASVLDLCQQTLVQSNCNWFELMEILESQFDSDAVDISEKFFFQVSNLEFTEHQVSLITQSKEAYTAAQNDTYDLERAAWILNGCVVSESESDDPEVFAKLKEPLSEQGRMLISKRRKAIRRRARRSRAKAIAERRLLSKKKSDRCSKILSECKDIGKVIKKFVSDHNVGADQWRRTGVLTFDGNSRLPQKVTYESIRRHLQDVYKRHFSYGTVVQLCVPRNKRRMSSKRYRGVAMVTTRRARKGFTLKYNPDAHWSAAFYRGLGTIQLRDGRNMVLINRDDASGFRLDTLTTCKQYAQPVVKGKDILTTRTDYVNKYPSTLQTTSYNFTGTDTTMEVCVGVVKAPSTIHPKNPCQHSADLDMLESKEELQSVFINQETGESKIVDCVRVDGASDEGPSHEEVQFYWTRRHLMKGKVATLITTRSSGSSYLNRVELQNGCLSRGHSGTFIPSTIAGSCMDTDTGTVNTSKLKENMNLAIEAYINRVNGCPCGETTIHLFRGADSTEQQETREKLLIFLKGSVTKKKLLQTENPTLYSEFQLIWNIRANHMVPGLPYCMYFLLCCYKKDCPHPRCQAGPPLNSLTWYPGGPLISNLPFPVPDPQRPWGSTTCSSCAGVCSGHYTTSLVDVLDSQAVSMVPKPPSAVLKRLFSSSNGQVSDEMVENAAREVLLPPEEWLDHLQTVMENRRRGARKAAATRKAKQSQTKDKGSNPTPTRTSQSSVITKSDVSVKYCTISTYSALGACGTCMCIYHSI